MIPGTVCMIESYCVDVLPSIQVMHSDYPHSLSTPIQLPLQWHSRFFVDEIETCSVFIGYHLIPVPASEQGRRAHQTTTWRCYRSRAQPPPARVPRGENRVGGTGLGRIPSSRGSNPRRNSSLPLASLDLRVSISVLLRTLMRRP